MNTSSKTNSPKTRQAAEQPRGAPTRRQQKATQGKAASQSAARASNESKVRAQAILKLAKTDHVAKAEALLADYLAWPGLDSPTLLDLAEGLYACEQEDMAAKAFEAVGAMVPGQPSVIRRVADLALRRGDPFTAAKLFRRLVTDAKEVHEWMYTGLADALQSLGDVQGALRCLERTESVPGIDERVRELRSALVSNEWADISEQLLALPSGVKGCVERVLGVVAEGWAIDTSRSQRPIEIEVVDAGKVVATASANQDWPLLQLRSSVLAGKGFRIELPPELLEEGREPSLVFRDKETGVELTRFGFPETADPGVRVTLTDSVAEVLKGSYIVTGEQSDEVRLQVWIDGVQLTEVRLDSPSGEFEMAVPREFLDGHQHSFLVFVEPNHTLVTHARLTTSETGLPGINTSYAVISDAITHGSSGRVPASVLALVLRIRASALFDVAHYSKKTSRRFGSAQEAVLYYLAHPKEWSVPTSPWLDPHFVALLAPELVGREMSPLEWYLRQPASGDVGPNALFSNADYLTYSSLDPSRSRGPTLFDRWLGELQTAPVNPSALVCIRHFAKSHAIDPHDGAAVKSALLAWLTSEKRDPSQLHPAWNSDWLGHCLIIRQLKLSEDWLTAMRIGTMRGIAPHPILHCETQGGENYYQLLRRYELLCSSAAIDDIESLSPLIDPERFYEAFPPQHASSDKATRTSSLYRYLTSEPSARRASFLVDVDDLFIETEYPGLIDFCSRERGIADLNRIWSRWLRPLRIPGDYQSAITQRGSDTVAPHDLAGLRDLSKLPDSEVRASLVIPTYGRDDLVLRCVLSIAKSHTRPDAEVLIAEDAAHVDCGWILGYFLPFADLRKNEHNLGFLLNCNKAVQRARGEVIVLVNNDVLVHRDALVEMMQTFNERQDAAVVGGLILNANGTVQENGGIMWSDGSAWNYHRNLPLEQENLRNVREADYVTGAWIGIRQTFWNELGGFDTRFTPAYCEEADLCLSAAARGRKVYINPHSVVTHLEGATMGTDEHGPTLKAHQVTNGRKLYSKWHPVLSVAHNANGNVTPFHTGRFNKNRFITVMFDHYIPERDRDAGSRTIYAICEAMAAIENNYVIFVPANNLRSKYAPELERLGIEVITGSEGWKRFDHLLANHAGMIKHAFVSRVDIARQYAWHLDQMKCAKSLYIHDIDTLRAFSYRPGSPGFEKMTQIAIREYVTRNADVFSKFHSIISCSQDETDHLRPYLGDRLVNLFPYDIETLTTADETAQRKDLLFVGSYNHPPNREGIDWFIRHVWPSVSQRLGHATLHIVGSGFENATFPADARLILHGQVTDQTLNYLYGTCRISIAPLISGAGIKGKLIEACAKGIPCVGTAAAWQGLTPPAGYEFLPGTNESFGDRLVQTYESYDSKMSRDLIAFYDECAGRDHISVVVPSLVRTMMRKWRT